MYDTMSSCYCSTKKLHRCTNICNATRKARDEIFRASTKISQFFIPAIMTCDMKLTNVKQL